MIAPRLHDSTTLDLTPRLFGFLRLSKVHVDKGRWGSDQRIIQGSKIVGKFGTMNLQSSSTMMISMSLDMAP